MTGNVVKADRSAPQQEDPTKIGREVVIQGVSGSGKQFEIVLRMPSDAAVGDVLGSVAQGAEITVEVTQ